MALAGWALGSVLEQAPRPVRPEWGTDNRTSAASQAGPLQSSPAPRRPRRSCNNELRSRRASPRVCDRERVPSSELAPTDLEENPIKLAGERRIVGTPRPQRS